MKILFILHDESESPAAFLIWAQRNRYLYKMIRIYRGETLPHSTEEFDLLIILGGPQRPNTTPHQDPYFNASVEISFIRSAIARDRLVLGVCLGAQLIGEALDAKFLPSPEKEIGIFPIELSQTGQQHPLFSHFPDISPVAHWHNDMPGLTADAKIIASSQGCPHQIVEYSNKVFGFQCHLEFSTQSVQAMTKRFSQEIKQNQHKPFVQTALEICHYDYSEMNGFLFLFLDKWLKQSKAKRQI